MRLPIPSAEQLRAYERDGLFALPGGVAASDARAMADQLWRAMERKYSVRRDAPETWTVHIPSGLTPSPADAFAAMGSPAVSGVLNCLLGGDWIRPPRWGMPLVTFPSREIKWDVPSKQWHLDSPATAQTPAVARVFVLLAPLRPRSGGTLVATGSHLLAQRLAAKAEQTLNSAETKRRLVDDHAWFAALMSAEDTHDRVHRFMQAGAIMDSVEARIVEMTGDAGDVYFMHPNALHAPSTNTGERPRLMLTQWINGRS
jgi:hypothetical protein